MGKAKPIPWARRNRDVDADQLAVDVDQRPPRVAGVDARVGLHQVAINLLVRERHVTV